jgi:hypothetical protein
VIPEGSGDYAEMLAQAKRFKSGELTFDELVAAARHLAVHPLGDAYLMIPVPMPPPGHRFDPRMMPRDWEGTFGELAMAYWLGVLTREDYDRVHAAVHPTCP